MSDEAASRIRWNDTELQDIADAMAVSLAAEPRLHILTAARRAMEKVIDKDRQRHIKAWSVIEPKVGPLLVEAQEALKGGVGSAPGGTQAVTPEAAAPVTQERVQPAAAGEPQAAVDTNGPAETVQSTAKAVHQTAEGVGDARSGEAAVAPLRHPAAMHLAGEQGALGAMLAVSLESAMLVALQSRQVEDALTGVFARAFKRAIDEREDGSTRQQQEESPRTGQRVLLAGFPIQMAKGIEEALRSTFDVRRWTPNQGPQMLETLTRMCSIAVIPEEADDEMGDAFRGRDLQVVRHEGSASRLAEKLSTMLC